MNLPEEAIAKSCCADLYQSDLARMILGDTLHPGGLALTNRLGRMMGIQPGDWVADLACGRGTSAMAVSRAFHCKVVGIEFGSGAAAEARASALEAPIRSETFFVRGDAEQPPLRSSVIDAVLCECSMSIFPDKPSAVKQVKGVLRPGGRFGLSDVTVEPGSLPQGLNNVVGQVLCLADALSVAGYENLLTHGGMKLQHQEDASDEIINLLDDLAGKLGMILAWQKVSQPTLAADQDWLRDAPDLITEVRQLVTDGKLGYWLFVAEKPA